jgi:hypothetical protein
VKWTIYRTAAKLREQMEISRRETDSYSARTGICISYWKMRKIRYKNYKTS